MQPQTQKLQYNRLDIALATPRAHGGSTLRQLLSDLEFRAIRTVPDIAKLRHAISARTPDILVAEDHKLEGNLCKLIQDIRHGKLGDNSFMGIIVATWDPSESIIRRAVNAGADDILAQPLSRNQIGDRIAALIQDRKPFVVTSTYIGPDRRRETAPDRDGKPKIDVPNFLHEKATGEFDADEFEKKMRQAQGRINAERMLETANALLEQSKSIQTTVADQSISEKEREIFVQLLQQGSELIERLERSPLAPMKNLCRSYISVIRRILSSSNAPDGKDIDLMPEIAHSIFLGIRDTAGELGAGAQILEEIDRSLNDAKSA